MFLQYTRALASLVALVALIYALGGCGSNLSGAQPLPTMNGNLPDRVQIEIQRVDMTGHPPQLTLRTPAQVQQFYRTLFALPAMPGDIACTADLGPHYTLTFFAGTQKLVQAVAKREGCGPVAISGEAQERRASQAFWAQLDQVIYAATPPATVKALAIQHTLPGNQPVQTAHMTDAASAQRLYSALVSLPRTQAENCNDSQYPEYRMIFQASDQTIPAVISQQCQTLTLSGNYQSRSGVYRLTDQFKQLFSQTLATTTFAPAQPDELQQTLNAGDTSSHGPVTDAQLMRQLYASIFTLKSAPVAPDCPSGEDKVKGTAKWYTLDFTQWGLPVMTLSVYEGSCKLIQPSPGLATGQTLLGDAGFWDLLHRAAHG